MLLRITLAIAAAMATATTPAAAADFYSPPANQVSGRPGTVIATRPAKGLAALPAAARTTVVIYRSRSVDGRPIASSGTIAIPRGRPPRGGWPVVSFFHVTTGSADSCAPSRATPGNPEVERLTRADAIAERLLRARVAVVRPDGEGIGTPGPHPYLVGSSLARSQVDIVRAARRLDKRLSRRWVAAGHSEGAVASMWSGALARQLAPDLDLRGVAAVSPVTRIRDQVDLLRNIAVTGPGIDGLSALAGLIVTGAGEDDPRLGRLLRAGALSPVATALLPHIEQRCLVELTRPDSWGGLAPAAIAGPRFDEARPFLYAALDANDVRGLDLRRVPVRIDHGALDLVAPLAFTEELVLNHRARGAAVTFRRWPTATHVDITDDAQAAPAVVAWVTARLR